MTRIDVRNVTKSFPARPPVTALDDVELTIGSGHIVALLGPSGCGKTTLLRIIAGFERPDRGSVSFDGVEIAGPSRMIPAERRGVGIVPQEGGLFPHLDVSANIAFGLRNLPRAQRRQRVAELLELVGLPGLGRRRPDELSGGQQQRVALARALARRPGIVLLDEPFAALDTSLRGALRDAVCDVLRATGTTALIVTHDQAEALTSADEVAVMRAGRVVQVGTPQQIYRQPVDLDTARSCGECAVLPGRLDGDRVSCPLGRLPVVAGGGDDGGAVVVMVRPEQIRLSTDGIAAAVRSVRFEGAMLRVVMEVDGHQATARWPAAVAVQAGDLVTVAVDGPVQAYPA